MVAKYKYLIFTIPLLLSSAIFPQEAEILKKQNELAMIKDEISWLEKELSAKSEKEKESFATIENYNRQSFLLNKLIISLKKEEMEKEREINEIGGVIKSIEEDIEILKRNYAKYVVAVYKKGTFNELESIIDAESMQQAIYRVQYLKKFSEKREQDLIEFNEKKKLLNGAIQDLEREKITKSELVFQKEKESDQLQKKLDERRTALSAIKEDKVEILKLLDARKNAQIQIENLIVELVEEYERRKKEQERLASGNINADENMIVEESNPGLDYNLNTSTFASFTELKGKMIWPLYQGKIIRKFGENKNKKLNTVTLNHGVDIEADRDLNVKCVAEGFVSAIEWIPGYGSVVIVTHNDGYRTVYSHLSEIYVSEGDEVKSGSLLAKVGESIDGNVLHFEIWKARDKRNPELWLAKK